MKTRILNKQKIEAEPFHVWNAYVDLLAMEDFDDLSPEQRPAHLVFWYESEVQNGGYFQYFENHGTKRLTATVGALGLLGATCQQHVLREAGELWFSRSRSCSVSVEEFFDSALDGEFEAFDNRFHACSPSLIECLRLHLSLYQSTFVIVA
jgi:hypothetical protein